MVGQRVLIDNLETLVQKQEFPRFSILCAPNGFGKKTLCRYIAKKAQLDIVFYENTMEELRKCMDLAYTYTQPIMIVLCDGDSMHISAKNSILKLVEEPPLNTYIVLLSQSKELLLDTIRTRGPVFEFTQYSEQELQEYCEQVFPTKPKEVKEELCKICLCPGEILEYESVDTKALKDYCNLILDRVFDNELSGVLKIPASFFVKESKPELKANNFPYTLVVNTLIAGCLDRIKQGVNISLYARMMQILCKYRNILGRKGVSTARALDNLFIEVWEVGHSRA